MKLQLRVIQGKLKRHDGANLGSDIPVRGSRFVIGSGPESHMRCPSSSISESHCELVAEGAAIFLRDLFSESGTFVNGERVTAKRQLAHGDRLRVGKLEFEVVMTAATGQGAAPPPVPPPVPPLKKIDTVGDNISEMLSEADAVDRAQSLHDPKARQFQPPPPPPPVEEDQGSKKKQPPPKKPPGKLPPPPKIVADNTVNAAEEVLKKFFDNKPKK